MTMKPRKSVARMYFIGNKWKRAEGYFGVYSIILRTIMASKGLVALPTMNFPMTLMWISIVNISQSKDPRVRVSGSHQRQIEKKTGIGAAVANGMK
jgi:hypothetical protein